MEVSGQLHAPASLPQGKSPCYPLDRRVHVYKITYPEVLYISVTVKMRNQISVAIWKLLTPTFSSFLTAF